MKGLSYTQRTLRYLREHGLIAAIAERFNPYAGRFGKRIDLFGFIDLIVLDPKEGIVAVQSTSGNCHAAHRRKIIEEKTYEVVEWLKCGGKIWLMSWSKKLLQRGGKARRWVPRIEKIDLEVLGIQVLDQSRGSQQVVQNGR